MCCHMLLQTNQILFIFSELCIILIKGQYKAYLVTENCNFHCSLMISPIKIMRKWEIMMFFFIKMLLQFVLTFYLYCSANIFLVHCMFVCVMESLMVFNSLCLGNPPMSWNRICLHSRGPCGRSAPLWSWSWCWTGPAPL